ncbi:MAG: DUF4124 domain-containing protein [Burkholderiaceae bacterium]
MQNFIVAALACAACVAAQAQWQWIDKDGRKVFSDRAPPPEIQDKNIVKRPNSGARGAEALANAAPAAPASAASAGATAAPLPGLEVPKLSGVDKELADRKKQAELAAAAKAKAEQDRVTKAKSENCQRARANKELMESGVRVAQAGANGERVVLDDTGRQAEIKRAQTAIDANCN